MQTNTTTLNLQYIDAEGIFGLLLAEKTSYSSANSTVNLFSRVPELQFISK